MIVCPQLGRMTSVHQDIGSVLEMDGSSDKRRKPGLIFLAVGIVVIFIGVSWYASLPRAMAPDTFRDLLTADIRSNFLHIDRHAHPAASSLAKIEQQFGPIVKLEKIDQLLNPRWTYPTLQAEVTVVRKSSKRCETYTFTVADEGRLSLVGFSSDSPR
jgi:hypothetical protein